MKNKIIQLILLSLILSLFVTIAKAQSEAPIIPAAFYGKGVINGRPIPVDSVVFAKIDDIMQGQITVDKEGFYGDEYSQYKLGVTGVKSDLGKDVSFFLKIAGYEEIKAVETFAWSPGSISEVDLTFIGDEVEEPQQNTSEPNTENNPTTPVRTTTGGGGSGAVGGSAVAQNPTDEVSYFYAALAGSKQKDIPVNNPSIALTKLQLVLNNEVSNVALKVKNIVSPPVPHLDQVYKYVEIDVPRIDQSNVAIAILKFKVPNSWFEENNAKSEDVVIMRFTQQWDQLETIHEGSDDNFNYYRAGTPGFSYFAVALKNAQVDNQDAVLDNAENVQEVNGDAQKESDEQQNQGNIITGLAVDDTNEDKKDTKLFTTILVVGLFLLISYIIYDKLIRG